MCVCVIERESIYLRGINESHTDQMASQNDTIIGNTPVWNSGNRLYPTISGFYFNETIQIIGGLFTGWRAVCMKALVVLFLMV